MFNRVTVKNEPATVIQKVCLARINIP